MNIQQTSSYHQFLQVDGNRKVSERHVRSLVNSIGQKNLMAANPIIVDDNFRVIDGQHRLEAARKLGVPVYYIMVDGGADLSDVQLINSAQKSWSLADYLQSYTSKGEAEYLKLQIFIERWDLTISGGIRLLTGEGENAMQLFRRGEFKITNELKALEVMEMMKVFKPYITRNIRRSKEFMKSVMSIVERNITTPEQMKERLDKYGKRLYQVDSQKEYLRQIEDMYNHGKQIQTRFW